MGATSTCKLRKGKELYRLAVDGYGLTAPEVDAVLEWQKRKNTPNLVFELSNSKEIFNGIEGEQDCYFVEDWSPVGGWPEGITLPSTVKNRRILSNV
jgi:hypothetical protein